MSDNACYQQLHERNPLLLQQAPRMVIVTGGMAQRMRLHKLLGIAILLCVVGRQSSFAQCGQTTQKPAVSTPHEVLQSSRTAKRNSNDPRMVGVGVLGCVHVSTLRVRVPSSVMGCLLLDRIEPIYPAETQNIKDQLRLAVLIGKDGNVLNVRKISGPENLAPTAVEAVMKWKYKPYLLNGEPIEVDTTVDLPNVNLPTGGCSAVLPLPYLLIRPMPSWLFNTKPIVPVLATQGAAK